MGGIGTGTRPLLTAVFALGLVGCATVPPEGPAPLYDFSTVWLNDGPGGVRPWKERDREAITAAAFAQDERWQGVTTPRPPDEERVADPGSGGAGEGASARAETPKAAEAGGTPPAGAPTASAEPAGGGAAPPPGRIPAEPDPPPEAAVGPLLGDGSVPGELLAAAKRLIGIRDGFGDGTFLSHALTVAAVDLEVAAPRARFDAAILERLREAERTFEGIRPEPGDLAFFHLPGDHGPSILAAVVERVRAGGVVVCIGEVHGRVRRFVADPERPWVRRDDQAGEEVNTPILSRSLGDDPDTPNLAGGLFVAWARP